MILSDSDYQALAHQIIKKVAQGGVNVEIYYSNISKLQIAIEESQIKSEREEESQSFCFRVAKDNRIGFTYSNSTDISKLLQNCQNAVQIARKSPENKNWSGFPSQQPKTDVKGIFDTQLAQLSTETIFENVNVALDALHDVETTNDVNISSRGNFSSTLLTEGIVNSEGIDCQDKRTSVFFYFYGNARRGDDVSGGVFNDIFSCQLKWKTEDLERFGRETGEKMISNLGSRSIPRLEGRIILHPEVINQLCLEALIPALSAEQIYAKGSPFIDKIGEQLFDSQIDIIDDGVLPGGINSSAFDGEGVSRPGKSLLVERGTLKNYLTDNYYSNIFNAPNTANALRRPLSIPKISSTNFIIVGKGTESLDELIQSTRKGALIGGFSGNSNRENGEFSGVCKRSFLIEDGILKHPLQETMIAGNFYEY